MQKFLKKQLPPLPLFGENLIRPKSPNLTLAKICTNNVMSITIEN